METFSAFVGKTLLGFCFLAFIIGFVLHLGAFFGLLWENRSDMARSIPVGKLMFLGSRSIQLIQLSVLLAMSAMLVIDNSLNPERLILSLTVGYSIAWALWVPLKLVLFMASGGSQRIIYKFFNRFTPGSPV